MHACSHELSSTLGTSMNYSPPDPLSMGFPGREILEQVIVTSTKGSSRPRDQICISCVSCIGRQILYHCTTRKNDPGKPIQIGILLKQFKESRKFQRRKSLHFAKVIRGDFMESKQHIRRVSQNGAEWIYLEKV